MNQISGQIKETIEKVNPELLKIPPMQAGKKLNPEKWSKKEILGHLIDSASNNLQRFVRAGYNSAEDFPPYNGDRWVEVQHYNEMDWFDLVELFTQLNLHLCRVINFLPENVFNNPVGIGKEEPVTLKFVVEDYLRHLKHHIEQIFR